MHNYHDTHQTFPFGRGGTGGGGNLLSNGNTVSGMVPLCPFIEQGPLYDQIVTGAPALDLPNLGNANLAPGELLRVDTGCLVAFESQVDYDIQWVKGIKNKFFGGEGLFFAALRGPGTVWLQTLPFSRLAGRIYAAAPQAGNKKVGEGSLLGSVFDIVGGD